METLPRRELRPDSQQGVILIPGLETRTIHFDQLYVTSADLSNEVGWLGFVSPFAIL